MTVHILLLWLWVMVVGVVCQCTSPWCTKESKCTSDSQVWYLVRSEISQLRTDLLQATQVLGEMVVEVAGNINDANTAIGQLRTQQLQAKRDLESKVKNVADNTDQANTTIGQLRVQLLQATKEASQNVIKILTAQSSGVRLVNGSNDLNGRLEVMHDGIWGTVCDDEFNLTDANVFCRNLGYRSGYQVYVNARFGQGKGPIWLDDVQCTGGEDSFMQCAHKGWGVENCNHGEDVSLRCSP